MTAIAILETLAREFEARVDHVQNALEMIDAGLSAPFIGRFRRAQVGGLSEYGVRRLSRRREELEELDRRRGTILRLLERETGVPEDVLAAIRACMDRFELEDLFIPHRRPEPEVQLALDRGLGALADLLVQPVPKAEREQHPDAHAATVEDGDESEIEPAQPTASAAPTAPEPEADVELAAAHTDAAIANADPSAAATDSASAENSVEDENEPMSSVPAPTLDAPATSVAHIDVRTAMNAQLARVCSAFVRPDKGVHTESEALSGALRILSDRLGRDARLRGVVRQLMRKHAVLTVRASGDEGRLGRYRALLKIKQPLRQVQGHRLLTIRQAQKERVVNTVITLDPAKVQPRVRNALGRFTPPAHAEVLNDVAYQALHHRLLPMVEQDVRLELKERADSEALRFLSQHLRQILFTPPIGDRSAYVAGVDVNAKGDWTVAILDPAGVPQGPEIRIETGEKDAAALGEELTAALAPLSVRYLAVGHGKGPRAALGKMRAALRAKGSKAFVFLVNEAGLSSYANSELARSELADRTVPARMAISLGRRLLDPMAEILKVDPRHLGLGTEQGLVSKANIRRVLTETIESCTAHVGCDANTAQLSFLQHLPGIDRDAARKIMERRTERPFQSRDELRADCLSEAQWTSAVAFLRVNNPSDPLDRTFLHPEQYALVRQLLDSAGSSVDQGLGRPGSTRGLRRDDFDIDPSTWRDVMREIAYPGRDPRARLWVPVLLEPDTDPVRLVKDRVVEGIVSNVASFGAFVDIGLAHDAMIHISEISDRYVHDARELLSIGQVVRARILDATGSRLFLSLKNVPMRERAEHREGPRGEGAPARAGGGRGRDERPERGRDSRGRDGRGRDGRGRGDHAAVSTASANVRAAQTRRDGLGGHGGGRGGRGGPGDKRGGPRRGPGKPGQGDEREERVRLDSINTGGKPAFSPFASFFKKKDQHESEPPGT